jgi:hypothetical protein
MMAPGAERCQGILRPHKLAYISNFPNIKLSSLLKEEAVRKLKVLEYWMMLMHEPIRDHCR